MQRVKKVRRDCRNRSSGLGDIGERRTVRPDGPGVDRRVSRSPQPEREHTHNLGTKGMVTGRDYPLPQGSPLPPPLLPQSSGPPPPPPQGYDCY